MSDDMTVYSKDYLTRRLLDVIGDQWRPIVIFILGKGLKRYSELQRCLPDVSKKMLTQTLRILEGDGLVKRTIYAEVPPKVEYELTALGRSFLEPVTSLCRWATTHTEDLDAVASHRKKSARRKKSPPGAK